ncbi:MAG: glycosyltransferase involved in cell wall biosynthesis [Polaribacter sp.]|jgi:glycosyltransferase involved in cell wall biosynthesis
MTKKEKDFHVVYLGETTFPIGFGAIQRMIMVSKALMKAGAKVNVINRKGSFNPDKPVDVSVKGNFEGIDYIYTSGTVYRPKGFLGRNWQKVVGAYKEWSYLKELKRNGKLDVGIISCYDFGQVLLYKIYSKLIGFPIAYNYVEWASAIEHRRGLKNKINDYLYDKWLVPSMDGALPISEVLIDNFKKVAPSKSSFKIPILCDFDKFDVEAKKPEHPYFAYCGALDYGELIIFVLTAFDNLKDDPRVELHMALGGGTQADDDGLMNHIKNMKKGDRVKIFKNVPHDNIPDLYAPSIGLLIPMRPTLQDAARFPHKIGEYVASGAPMISSNFGEVKYYFKDMENGFVADKYEVEQFTEKMQYIIDNPEKARQIGQAGKATGLKEFNFLHYGENLRNFLEGLNGKKKNTSSKKMEEVTP